MAVEIQDLSLRARRAIGDLLGLPYYCSDPLVLTGEQIDQLRKVPLETLLYTPNVGRKTVREIDLLLGRTMKISDLLCSDAHYLADGYWTEVGIALQRHRYKEAHRLWTLLGEQLVILRKSQQRVAHEQDATREEAAALRLGWEASARDWAIFHLAVVDGCTMREAGRQFHVSPERVRQIVWKVARGQLNVTHTWEKDLKALRAEFQCPNETPS